MSRLSGRFGSVVITALLVFSTFGCVDDEHPADTRDGGDVGDTSSGVADVADDGQTDVGPDAPELDSSDAFELNATCEPITFNDEGMANIEFTIESDSTGFLWTAFGLSQRPEIESIIPPSGVELPSDRLAKLFASQDLLSDDAVSILLTQSEVSPLHGTWGATLRRREAPGGFDACSTLLQQSGASSGGVADDPKLAVRFVLVADPGSFATRVEEDAALQRLAGSAGSAIGTLGVEFRPSGWTVAVADVRSRFSVLFDEADFDALVRTSYQYLREPNGREVVVFLVEGFAKNFGGSGGISVGQSGSIPGAPAIRPSDAGAVVVSLDGVDEPTSAEYLGKVLGHELGHYLGLSHTTEQTGDSHDTLSDTPECGLVIRRNYTLCEDSENLMFPLVRPNAAAKASPSQRLLVRHHPLVGPP